MMQLIQPKEDRNATMSAETESPVKGNVSEILKEINLSPNTNGATIAYVQDTFDDKRNISPAEMSDDTMPEEKECQDNKVHSPVSKLVKTENGGLIKNENVISERMVNGTPSSQELQPLEIHENNIISKEAVDTELCRPITQTPSDENLGSFTSTDIQSNLNNLNKTNDITSCKNRKEIVKVSDCDKPFLENTSDTSEINDLSIGEVDATVLKEKNELPEAIDQHNSCAAEKNVDKIERDNMTIDLDTEIEKSASISNMSNNSSENKTLEIKSAPTPVDDADDIDMLENGINGNNILSPLKNLNVSNTVQSNPILLNIDSDQEPNKKSESNISVGKPINPEDATENTDVEKVENPTIQDEYLENFDDILMEESESASLNEDSPEDTVKKDIVDSREEFFESTIDISVADTDVALPVSDVCNSEDAIKETDVNIVENDTSQTVRLQTVEDISMRIEKEDIIGPKSEENVQKIDAKSEEQNTTHNKNLKVTDYISSTEPEAASSDVNKDKVAVDIENELKESANAVKETESFPSTEKSSDGNGSEKTTHVTSMEVDDSEIDNLGVAVDIGTELKESADAVKQTESFPITEKSSDEIGSEETTHIASMEVDDTEIDDLDAAVDIENELKESPNAVKQSESFPITEKSTEGNGSEKTTHIASMVVDETEIINLDDEKIEEVSTSKSRTTSTDTAWINVSVGNETKAEVLLGTASEESVILCKDIDSNASDESTPNIEICNTTLKEANNVVKDKQETINIIDEDDVNIVENKCDVETLPQNKENSPEREVSKTLPVVCKLSNTLDILSDDEEEPSNAATNTPQTKPEEKQSINIDDDDDDIMLIEEDLDPKESQSEDKQEDLNTTEVPLKPDNETNLETNENQAPDFNDLAPKIDEKDTSLENISTMDEAIPQNENIDKTVNNKKPLLPQNFLKTAKKSLAEMSRHELEDFCILRIVESIVDRSNLSEIKTKMKTMAQNLEDYRKRTLMMTKQNRDLQVVLKSVQEEQKKQENVPIQPLKITRSVGMQVLMNDKVDARRKAAIPTPTQPNLPPRAVRPVQNTKPIKLPATPPIIPVPRKVPVINSPVKTITNASTSNMGNKSASPSPSGLRNPSPVQKMPEKRTHSRMQSTSGVTVDLTDDEPPSKINNKTAIPAPVRVVPPQSLMPQNKQFGNQPLNNARKVFIPISGPTAQIRPGQTLMVRPTVHSPGPRQRLPAPVRPQQNATRPRQIPRHPAPLPDAMKQYTPPTWKNLPPAPDLKLSKLENGIVISWKIDGYPDGSYETIASYQLYAYQETSAPPCTALWKKIGDVKALALPMACTLTQFMAGYKYYFAVRAVDIRSRLGPFSLPGSILLLNKV